MDFDLRRGARAVSRGTVIVAVLACCTASLGISDVDAQRVGKRGDILPAVTLTEVAIERMNQRVAAVGSGRARQQVTLTTRVAGVIDKVQFDGGQLVEANQPLVQLDSATEQVALETAQAQRAQAADTVERYRQLNEGTVTKVAINEANTALKVADAAMRKSQDELDRMTIKAPFKGIMGLSNLQAGDYLAVGSPIAPIDDRSTIIIEFTVPEAVASSMKAGLPVRANLITRTGEVIEGAIQAVGTRIDPVSRTLAIRGEIPNPDLKLIPGSTFSISVQLPGQDSPVVPALAIQWDRQGAFVWRVNDQNIVERVNAAILDRDGDKVYIDALLKAGDKIVKEGGSSLRAGQTVNPQSS